MCAAGWQLCAACAAACYQAERCRGQRLGGASGRAAGALACPVSLAGSVQWMAWVV